MGKVGSFFPKVVLPFALSAVVMIGIRAYGQDNRDPQTDFKRSDVIMIDMLKSQGALERPGVAFPHDLHAQALKKMQKDCTACHLPEPEKNRLSLKFQRIKDGSKSEVSDIYHSKCITCHKQMALTGEKSGPVTCGECHREKPRYEAAEKPFGFDKSLHARHVKAAENKCERCHHEYNSQTQKLFYAKGKEGTCRYCHQDVAHENRISFKTAAHIDCLDCHLKTAAQGKKAGPAECGGCHDPLKQAKIEKLANIPRIPRNQPDSVWMKLSKTAEAPEGRMNYTPFDHKAHEGYTDTCRVCHHESMAACNTCHTQLGTKEGKWVTLELAMHQRNALESCKGCHNTVKARTNCAGCHHRMTGNSKNEQVCQACHIKSDIPSKGSPLPADQEPVLARSLLDARTAVKAPFTETLLMDMPEKLTIKTLSHQYEPVEFPHRKIVQTLLSNISDNKLAEYFHSGQMTLCQGCHHNSPASLKPPKCESCHNKPFNDAKDVPGLLGAFHQQCMGCHQAMHITKPMGCTECHKEKIQ